MKKIWVLLIASVLFVSFAGISFAQQGAAPAAKGAPAAPAAPAKAEPAKAAPAKASALIGKITAIDNGKVTIESKKAKTTLDVAAAQLGSLKVGEKVKVTFKDDGKTVDKIEAMAKKGKK